jgi:hypothetical protein
MSEAVAVTKRRPIAAYPYHIYLGDHHVLEVKKGGEKIGIYLITPTLRRRGVLLPLTVWIDLQNSIDIVNLAIQFSQGLAQKKNAPNSCCSREYGQSAPSINNDESGMCDGTIECTGSVNTCNIDPTSGTFTYNIERPQTYADEVTTPQHTSKQFNQSYSGAPPPYISCSEAFRATTPRCTDKTTQVAWSPASRTSPNITTHRAPTTLEAASRCSNTPYIAESGFDGWETMETDKYDEKEVDKLLDFLEKCVGNVSAGW